MVDSCSPQRKLYDKIPIISSVIVSNAITKFNTKFDMENIKNILQKVTGSCPRWNVLHDQSLSISLTKPDVNNLVTFRRDLVNFIYTNICNAVECKDVGSTEPTSDVNVSITSKSDDGDILASYSTLLNIQSFMVSVFSDIEIFKENDQTSLYKILRFFDINFYLTNFNPNRINANSSKPILSTNYNYIFDNTTNTLSQYFYAFYELFQLEDRELEWCSKYTEQYNSMYNKHKDLQTYEDVVNKLNTALTAQQDDNNIINLVSLLSTFENECYHT